MAKSQITAYLVPGEQVIERRLATISTHPMKVAFLINENISKEKLVKYFEYNTAIWGGYYSLLVPTDGQTLREDWWQTLLNYDPDLVIAHGEISSQLVEKLQSQIQPYHVWQWQRDHLLYDFPSRNDYFRNILMQYGLQYEDEVKYIPPIQFKLRVPQIPSDCLYYEYTAAQFGIFPEKNQKIFMERLQGQFAKFNSDDLQSYLRYIEEVEKTLSPTERILTPILATRSGLSADRGGIENKDVKAFTTFIVLTGNHFVPDFCLFWNLRMQSALGHSRETLIIPFLVFQDQQNIQALAQWCNQSWDWLNHFVLVSTSLSKEQLISFKKRLIPHLEERIESVDIWFANFVLNGIQIRHETRNDEELTFKDRIFRLHIPRSSFVEYTHEQWVVDIHIENEGWELNGFLPPKYPGLNQLLSNDPYEGKNPFDPGFSIRFANDRNHEKKLSYRVHCNQKYLTGKLPTAEEIFISLLKNKGYEAERTDKCRYTEEMISLIGGLQNVEISLKNSGFFEKLEKMKGGNVYTFDEIMSDLKRFGSMDHEKYLQIFRDFARRNIFLRGYKLQCPACDLTRWYAHSEINEVMRCAGCLTEIQPPVDALFHYKLNELVARNIDQGGIPVLLTLLFLKKLISITPFSSFMYVPGMKIRKIRELENNTLGFNFSEDFFEELRTEKFPKKLAKELREKLASFRLTEHSFAKLKEENIPDYILKKLEPLKNRVILGEDEFLDVIKKHIGEVQTVRYKTFILKHAEKLLNQEYRTKEDCVNALKTIIGEKKTLEQYEEILLKCASKKIDLDIIGSCNGHLFLVECKGFKKEIKPEKIEETFLQFAGMMTIAKDIGAEIVFLSVLSPNIPELQEFQERIAVFNKQAGESLSVHLLTGDELRRGYKTQPTEHINPDGSPREEPLYLYAFLPSSPQPKGGWVKDIVHRTSK